MSLRRTYRPLAAALALMALSCAALADEFTSGHITITRTGAGPDVILVPGLNSSPAVWKDLTNALDGYRFHLVHVHGFAGLPAGANASGPVVESVADEIARYVGEAGLDAPALIGHSMGGTAGVLVAAHHPKILGRLMVVDAPAFLGGIMGATPLNVDQMATTLKQATLGLDPEAWRAQETAALKAAIAAPDGENLAIEDMRASDQAVSAQAMYDVTVTDLRPLLSGIVAPTSVVFVTPAGAPDMTPDQIEGFYASQYGDVPTLELEFVPDAGHYVMLDQPEAFADRVADFLAR